MRLGQRVQLRSTPENRGTDRTSIETETEWAVNGDLGTLRFQPATRRTALALLFGALALLASGCRIGVVNYVVDGDTVDVDGVRVRIVGIDTPERGQCGYAEAKNRVAQLVLNQQVTVVDVGQGKDRYGRELGYIDRRDGLDVGRTLIAEGLAVARYDSLDGYPKHPRQDDYRALDRQQKSICK